MSPDDTRDHAVTDPTRPLPASRGADSVQGDSVQGDSVLGDTMIGSIIAERYLIDAVIGKGGMSTVYRATDTQLGRVVAIKAFRPDLADADDIRRQGDEVRMLASLNHPTLVTLFDSVSDALGRANLVLEYVEGHDLRERLAERVLDSSEAGLIGRDVSSALAYVHDRGIVHRDLKPGNLLIPTAQDGARAKLADFGIARLVDGTRMTATGNLIGTAAYLSPEQALGGVIGPASDMYSLGLVLLESLTGTRAYEGSSLEAAIARLSRDPEIPAWLGPEWIELLTRMTAREPGDRISARDSVAVLARLAEETPALAAIPARTQNELGENDATRVFRAADAPTQRFETAVPAASESTPSSRPSRLTPRVVVAIVIAIVGLSVIGAVAMGIVANSTAAPTTPDYPVIDGTVGDSLEQLQESVTP